MYIYMCIYICIYICIYMYIYIYIFEDSQALPSCVKLATKSPLMMRGTVMMPPTWGQKQGQGRGESDSEKLRVAENG